MNKKPFFLAITHDTQVTISNLEMAIESVYQAKCFQHNIMHIEYKQETCMYFKILYIIINKFKDWNFVLRASN